jgi:hypothetical protein
LQHTGLPYVLRRFGPAVRLQVSALRVDGRNIACRGISAYNQEKPRPVIPTSLTYWPLPTELAVPGKKKGKNS